MRREDTVRFLARIPYDSLWCDTLPTQYRLQLATQHDGRYEEYLELPLGFRTAEVRDGRMTINGREVALRCREVPGSFPASGGRVAARRRGTTRCACCPARFRRRCSTVATPGGSTSSYRLRWTPGGAAIRAAWAATRPTTPPGVRPTPNAPRTVTTRPSLHPSVIAFSVATHSANGINLYESYLAMKRLHETRPFVYPEAGGEWNNDPLPLE